MPDKKNPQNQLRFAMKLSSAVHLQTPPAAAGGDGRGGHTPAPLRRRAREVGRLRFRRPRGGSVADAPGSFRSTVRWNERPWGTGDGRHGWLVVAALAGPTRRGQATCAAVLAQPRARLRAPPFTSSASPRARVRRRAAATARTDATELWAPGALRLQLSGSTTHAQSQR